MPVDIKNALDELIVYKDYDSIEKNDSFRCFIGDFLLKNKEDIFLCEMYKDVAKYAKFPEEKRREVSLLVILLCGFDWGEPNDWENRFYQ